MANLAAADEEDAKSVGSKNHGVEKNPIGERKPFEAKSARRSWGAHQGERQISGG